MNRSVWLLTSIATATTLAASSCCPYRLMQEKKQAKEIKDVKKPGDEAPKPLTYPVAAKGEVVDTYHGVKVPDPYRWLEDPDSKQTRTWIDAENELTFGWLGEVKERPRIRQRLETLWNYERYGVPGVRKRADGARYFYTKNDGLQNQDVYYYADSLTGSSRVVLDPNAMSADGTMAVQRFHPSHNGELVAYGVSNAGSDWVEFKVREVITGKDTSDHLKWVKFSGASWDKDDKGFYYSRYDEPKDTSEKLRSLNYFQKLYYHRLGTTQAEDALVYHRPDQKEWGFGGHVTNDGRYLAITVSQGTDPKNAFFYQDLTTKAPVVELLKDFDARYDFLGNDGTTFWFLTDLDAPRARIIAIDVASPARDQWKELVPQQQETLESASVVGDRFLLQYLKDAHSLVRIHHLDGKLEKEIPMPTLGTAWGFGGRRSDRETFYGFSSFTHPTSIFRYDFDTGKSELFRKPSLSIDPDRYEVKQVFYHSKDGTRVPMFIAHRKGLKLDGSNPTYLYGYGGFNISITPYYSTARRVWLDMGGVYAVANLRGGNEYGEQWHQQGIKLKKQNVFDDFIAAAEWLIANNYTSTPRLAIGGGSNGGLLVGACMTQRPALFGAVVAAVGVMDMLRFHKFTIGWAWVSDYGSSDDPEEFKALRAYSPLHNLKEGTSYPATLITTADHDDRVVPAHSFKFAAALQAAHKGPAPTLIRIETKAGHGRGKPTAKVIDEVADKWAFLMRVFGLKLPDDFEK